MHSLEEAIQSALSIEKPVEIIGKKDEAIQLADKSFKDAVDLLDSLADEEYSEATLILQLLKDNVALWNEEMADK